MDYQKEYRRWLTKADMDPALLEELRAMDEKQQEDAFFLYETGERESLRSALKGAEKLGSAAVITGPEGGFEPYEADMARKVGLHVCSMGARILRCETAPVVALTALMYESGNLE